MDRANKTINELQAKLKQLEKKSKSEKPSGSVNCYLQEQVEFLAKQLDTMKLDLKAKDAAIEKIVQEKTEYATKFDRLELQNSQLMEQLGVLEREKDEAEKVAKSLQLIVTA